MGDHIVKWLLITTLGKNVGDEFVRIGIQNVIREVDPQAEFDLVCKESPEIHKPRFFDRAVICGMPLFWNLPYNNNRDIDWWNPIFRGWVSASPGKLAAAGVGSVIVGKISNIREYAASIDEVTQRCRFVTVRQPVMDHPQLIDSICPAAFAVVPEEPRRRLCNFMPAGGHHYCSETQNEDLKAWAEIAPVLARKLIAEGYEFVAHTLDESVLARQLGWDKVWYHGPGGVGSYLGLYGSAIEYIGNRLHGAVLVAAAGRPVLGIAADNRVKMVRRLGGGTINPRTFKRVVDGLGTFPLPNRVDTAWSVPQERGRLRMLLKEFMS